MINLVQTNLWFFTLGLIGITNILYKIDFGAYFIGDLIDGRLNNYILEHFYLALTNEDINFKQANFFYPTPSTIMMSDSHWLLGPFYSLFRIVGFEMESSFNLIILVGCLANFVICYYVLKKFNFSSNSSALSAHVFAFNQIILFKLCHMQLNFKIFVPLAVLFCKEYFDKKDLKYISYIILCITLQLFCSPYNGSFLAFFIFIIFLFFLGYFKINEINQIYPQKYSLKIAIPLLIVSFLALIIFGKSYLEIKNLFNRHAPISSESYFEIRDLFTIYNSPIIDFIGKYMPLDYMERNSENSFFIGFGVLLTFIYFCTKNFYKNLNLFENILLKSTIFMIIFFLLDKYLGTFYFLQIAIPSFANLRASNRFFYVVFFALVYFLTLAFNKAESSNKKGMRIFFYSLAITIIAESLFLKIIKTKIGSEKNNVESYQELMKKNGGKDSIFWFTQPKSGFIDEVNIMFAGQKQQNKSINGYSSFSPYKTNQLNSCKDAFDHLPQIEKSFSKIFAQEFKYDRDKLKIFWNKKLCTDNLKNNARAS